MLRVRKALLEDESTLLAIDLATWTHDVSPTPTPPADQPFFGPNAAVQTVLVAQEDGRVLGYIRLEQAVPLVARTHVLEISGLAVDPCRQRRGAGRALVDAAVVEARARGAQKLALRVLGLNVAARRLYDSCGFVVEGVLHEEFLLAGRFVDDVLMARHLRR